jgi:hypothetical protein
MSPPRWEELFGHARWSIRRSRWLSLNRLGHWGCVLLSSKLAAYVLHCMLYLRMEKRVV